MKYLDVLIEVNAKTRNKKYYESLGYEEKDGKFFIKCDDLPDHSGKLETRLCDICNCDFVKRHEHHVITYKRFGIDVCGKCVASNSFLKNKIQNKKDESWKKKYGGHPMKVDEIKNKVHQIFEEKYGCHPMHNHEVKEKWTKTLIEKYGGPSPFYNDKVRELSRITLNQNSNVPTSSQQKEIFNMLKLMYPSYIVELNKPLSYLSLDIYCEINEVKIDIEYDGSHWHKNRQLQDRRRDEFVKSNNIKIIRIKSAHRIPSFEELKEAINFLIENKHMYTEIKLDDW